MRALLSIIFAVFAANQADAQTLADSVRWEEEMQQMVVTATRAPKLFADTTVAMRIIGREDIERADVRNVAELLQQELPGVGFSMAMSRDMKINMCGFGAGSIVFLVDGERMAGETQNNIDYDRLATDNVEKIEIIRGAALAAYGSNATCAVINIITRQTARKIAFDAGLKAATHNNYLADARIGNKWKSISNELTGRWGHAGKYTMSPFAGAAGRRLVSPVNWNYRIEDRVTWQAAEWLKVSARCGYFFREREYDATQNNRFRDFSGGLAADCRFGHDKTLTIRYSFDQYDKSDLSLITNKDIRSYSNVQHNVCLRYGMEVGEKWRLSVGGDVLRDYLMSYMFDDGRCKEQYSTDAYAEAEWKPSARWNLVGGLRYDHCSGADANSVTAKLSAKWAASKNLTLRANYGGGFKPATLKELYMNYDMAGVFMLYGNESLKSECSHNLQLAAEFNRNGWCVAGTLIHSILNNRISTIWDKTATGLNGNRGAMRYINVRRMTVTTAEINAAKRFSNHWDGRISYSYTYINIPKGTEYSDDTRPHSLTARATYTTTFGRMIYQARNTTFKSHRITINLSARYNSALYIREFNSTYQKLNNYATRYGGFAIVKLTAQLSTPKGFAFTVTADNLLNYRPRTYTYYSPQTTGVTASIGVRYHFD